VSQAKAAIPAAHGRSRRREKRVGAAGGEASKEPRSVNAGGGFAMRTEWFGSRRSNQGEWRDDPQLQVRQKCSGRAFWMLVCVDALSRPEPEINYFCTVFFFSLWGSSLVPPASAIEWSTEQCQEQGW
jgi:hypothetical protein